MLLLLMMMIISMTMSTTLQMMIIITTMCCCCCLCAVLTSTLLFCCSKLDEDTQLALALSVSATTDSRDTNRDTVTQPATASPVKDILSVLTSSTKSPIRLKQKKKAQYVSTGSCVVYAVENDEFPIFHKFLSCRFNYLLMVANGPAVSGIIKR